MIQEVFLIQFLSVFSFSDVDWSYWPFGEGMTGSWILTLTKFIFIGVILAVILGFLRVLFGPKGFFRDEEMDREAEEERQRVREAVDVLRQRLANGEITEDEFQRRKWLLEK
ncbi:SHOCT domain-containing protein [Desulfonatronovibrio hydrogenovorans]|uniref:SHOCT domain-containing protein n=1 Tax=Desulfonatronovibrio hydrogenovorans TaxID=53245 RepID=UPI000555565B|nr:SHOCT domain-containing protein [Desulfonatronovibrio hydrogenovorans]